MDSKKDFRDAINYAVQRGSNVAKCINDAITTSSFCEEALKGDMDYFGVSEENVGYFSYLPKAKVAKVLEDGGLLYGASARQSMKAGKFVRKFFTQEFMNISFSDSEIETFGNLIKTFSSANDFKIEVVEGSDILEFYHEDSYFKVDGHRGTLWDSCMRHEECQPYFAIYTENVGVVSMAILKNGEGLIKGRAILYNTPDFKIMDRIYHYNDSDTQLFKDWAIENEYHYKHEQSYNNSDFVDYSTGEAMHGTFYTIPLTLEMDWEYPYMDTFKALLGGAICSERRHSDRIGELESTGGYIDNRRRECVIEGGWFCQDDMVLLTDGQHDGEWVQTHLTDHNQSNGSRMLTSEMTKCRVSRRWYNDEDITEVINREGNLISCAVERSVRNETLDCLLIVSETITAVDGSRWYEKDTKFYANIGYVPTIVNQDYFIKLEKDTYDKLNKIEMRKEAMLGRTVDSAKARVASNLIKESKKQVAEQLAA